MNLLPLRGCLFLIFAVPLLCVAAVLGLNSLAPSLTARGGSRVTSAPRQAVSTDETRPEAGAVGAAKKSQSPKADGAARRDVRAAARAAGAGRRRGTQAEEDCAASYERFKEAYRGMSTLNLKGYGPDGYSRFASESFRGRFLDKCRELAATGIGVQAGAQALVALEAEDGIARWKNEGATRARRVDKR